MKVKLFGRDFDSKWFFHKKFKDVIVSFALHSLDEDNQQGIRNFYDEIEEGKHIKRLENFLNSHYPDFVKQVKKVPK